MKCKWCGVEDIQARNDVCGDCDEFLIKAMRPKMVLMLKAHPEFVTQMIDTGDTLIDETIANLIQQVGYIQRDAYEEGYSNALSDIQTQIDDDKREGINHDN